MYLDYWQLNAKPFEPAADARFTFKSASYEAALRKLRYIIENQRQAALLAGPAGVGKTQLVSSLRETLGERSPAFAHVVFPQMSDRDLLVYLAERFGAPPADAPRYTIEESLRRLEFTLGENARQGRRAVIVIDEAHLLEDSGLLEPLRLLLNLNGAGAPAFTLLLVGQPALVPIIERHGGFEERLDMKVLLPALAAADSAEYIQHRLQAAGATRDIFTPDALTTAHQLCGGIPRRINRLCDLALLVGFAEAQHAITADHLHAVHDELIAVLPLAA
jgi:general secretion pathway protein A